MKIQIVITYLLIISILSCTSHSQTGKAKATPNAAQVSAQNIVKNREPLVANSFYLLPLTSIKPTGWLRRQLQIQADGITGHLDEFWPDVGPESAWLGGKGEGWERGPYYVDGLLPLAYLLDDPKLIAKSKKWIEWTLNNQRADGAIGPEKNKDWWPNMIMLKVLTQYQEATGDPRVIPLMERYFEYHLKNHGERPLYEWARYRWGDELLTVLWLYNRTGNQHLLELARALHEQGYDWKTQYIAFPFTAKTSNEQLGLGPGSNNTEKALSAHGVNNGMAMKDETLWSVVSGDDSDRRSIYRQLNVLDQYHLLPNGMHSGDEHFAGESPSQGVETCTVVETMFSLEHLIAIMGDVKLADRLEKITYNALPASMTKDTWSHQYDQQPNQVLVDVQKRDWVSNGPESNIFGLEPNFGCCTANLHQGWPKFISSLWMATSDDGLAAVTYGPNEVKTKIKGGVPVSIMEETEYPFRDRVRFTVNTPSAVSFPLKLRIPEWAQNATVTINKEKPQTTRAGTFHTIERQWKNKDTVELTLPLTTRTSNWFQKSIAIERGPLVFSLRIGEDWRRITQGMHKPATGPVSDWEVRPTTAWNYGLILPEKDVSSAIKVVDKPIGEYPFSAEGTPVELQVKGRRIPEWKLVNGSAGPPPTSPVTSREPEENLTLIPYGAAKLRVTAFPLIAPAQ